MSHRHDLRHEKPELALKDASRRLIGACGGGDGAGETLGRRQQHMSDCGNRFTDRFLRVDEAARLEDVSAGHPGWPHVTRAMAKRQGFVLAPIDAGATDPDGLLMSLSELTAELGDVAQALTGALRPCSPGGRDCNAQEAQVALGQLDDVDRAAARLRAKLRAIIEGGAHG